MKQLQLIGLIVCAAFFISCESTQTAGTGNQEQKRLAALQQQQEQQQQYRREHPNEGHQNLWNAQQDTLNQDGNPMRTSY
jgi:hypothetical protein